MTLLKSDTEQQPDPQLRSMLSKLIKFSPDAAAVVDKEQKIIICNDAFCSIFDQDYEDVENSSIRSLLELYSSLQGIDENIQALRLRSTSRKH